jgi:alpha-ketoglutarate-dependent taurine dioxygenase
MLTSTTLDPRAWRANTIDAPASWYYPLSERGVSALDEAVQEWRRDQRPVTELSVSAPLHAACARDLRPVLKDLEEGRGFAIITGLPAERYSPPEAQMSYWLVGQVLGRPFEQNVQGTLLYDVRDTGQDVAYGARFSVTNAESTFHTDNSFGDTVLDYVGLLCIRPAKAGGRNQVVSGYTVVAELQTRHPEVLEVLSRPFHIDRRGGVREGEAPTSRHPILERNGAELTIRYLRYWIETGHQKAAAPLTPAQVEALGVLDGLLGRPDFRVEFGLRSGEMFFINNRWILHNRTAFEDHTDPEKRRHYVRLWLKASSAASRGAGIVFSC